MCKHVCVHVCVHVCALGHVCLGKICGLVCAIAAAQISFAPSHCLAVPLISYILSGM